MGLGCAALGAARAQGPWTVESSPTQADLNAVCAGGSGYVAVGAGGTILTSPDGAIWTAQQSGISTNLNGVAFGNGIIVAVGDGGVILTSPDGVTWTQVAAGGPALRAVILTDSGYVIPPLVAVGDSGTILMSFNGQAWTSFASGTSESLTAVIGELTSALPDAFPDFMAAGTEGIGVGSFNFVTISAPFTLASQSVRGLVGASETGEGNVTESYGIAVGDGGSIEQSLYGPGPWPSVASPTTANLNAVACSGGYPVRVVAAGDGGATVTWSGSYGSPWLLLPSATTEDLLGLCSGYQGFVAVGRAGTILFSGFADVVGLGGVTSQLVGVGGSTVLAPPVTGTGPLSYQWSYNGDPIAGATNPQLTLQNLQLTNAGTYSLTVSNSYSQATSAYAVSVEYSATIPGLVDQDFQSALPEYNGPQSRMWAMPDGGVLLDNGQRLAADGSEEAAFVAAFRATGAYLIFAVEANGALLATMQVDNSPPGPHPVPEVNTFVIIRLNPDGSLDTSFSPLAASALVPLANGQYLASDVKGAFYRVNADGSTDSSYVPLVYTNGALVASAGYVPATAQNYILGWTAPAWAVDSESASLYFDQGTHIWRFNPDGTFDPTYAATGQPANLTAMTVQNGEVLFVGQGYDVSDNQYTFLAGRLSPSGALDPTYAPISIPPPFSSHASTWAQDGSLYVNVSVTGNEEGVGSYQYPTLPIFQNTYRAGIVRFGPNGQFDPPFTLNLDGQWETGSPAGIYAADSEITALAFRSDGELYVGGGFSSFNGQAASQMVRLNLAPAAQPSALANLSARGFAGTGDDALIGGFVVGNTGSDSLLLRGIGPSLQEFGVPGALPEASLIVYNSAGDTELTASDWSAAGNAASVAASAATVGAFALADGSQDAATAMSFGPGAYTFHVQGPAGQTGVALAELYDLDPMPPPYGTVKLVNVSARSVVGPGANALIAGFVVGGSNSKRVLLRATGPTLAEFGVNGVLPDPVISLYSGGTLIATQQGGASQAPVVAAATAVGAFPIPSGTTDSAFVITLSPGSYTAQVTSASGATGEALAEVYEIP